MKSKGLIKFLLGMTLLIVVAKVSYEIGMFKADIRTSAREWEEFGHRFSEWPKSEEYFLQKIPESLLRPLDLKTGNYNLEISIPGEPLVIEKIYLPFEESQFAFPQPTEITLTGMETSAKIDGHVVSWFEEGVLFDAGVKYVGLVSGDEMFGRVYNYSQERNGEIGFWRIYPEKRHEKI